MSKEKVTINFTKNQIDLIKCQSSKDCNSKELAKKMMKEILEKNKSLAEVSIAHQTTGSKEVFYDK